MFALENYNDQNSSIVPLILNTFYFLEVNGYVSAWENIESKVFLKYLNVEYTNDIRRRKIVIAYAQSNCGIGETSHTFSASISRIPYSGTKDFFSLNAYLNKMNQNFDSNIEISFDKLKAKHILERFAKFLKRDLKDIIEGEVWYENYQDER
ncbi:MAG: hypothetical protein EOP53_03390 [Sphingobacteriales bacterium]|nr:MAG: hypothetical protein EOP53_03390 [Sphingobacteriales bacterium]